MIEQSRRVNSHLRASRRKNREAGGGPVCVCKTVRNASKFRGVCCEAQSELRRTAMVGTEKHEPHMRLVGRVSWHPTLTCKIQQTKPVNEAATRRKLMVLPWRYLLWKRSIEVCRGLSRQGVDHTEVPNMNKSSNRGRSYTILSIDSRILL